MHEPPTRSLSFFLIRVDPRTQSALIRGPLLSLALRAGPMNIEAAEEA